VLKEKVPCHTSKNMIYPDVSVSLKPLQKIPSFRGESELISGIKSSKVPPQ